MSDSLGWAAQAGIDLDIGRRSFVNFDIKYFAIDATATLTTTAIDTQRVKVNLNPLVIGAGVVIRF